MTLYLLSESQIDLVLYIMLILMVGDNGKSVWVDTCIRVSTACMS